MYHLKAGWLGHFDTDRLQVLLAHHVGQQEIEAGKFIVIDLDSEKAIFTQQGPQEFETGFERLKPLVMVATIRVERDSIAGVVGRIEINTLDAAGILFRQCLQHRQIIAKNNPITEKGRSKRQGGRSPGQ